MSESPQNSFEDFLAKAVGDSWIESYRWTEASSSAALKSQMGQLARGYSRTNKTAPDGALWALEVQAKPGIVVGVDLELIKDRPILQNPQWLADRFQLTGESCTPKKILEEWVSREAVFKALAPQNGHLMLSSFYKMNDTTYGVIDDVTRTSIETCIAWSETWVLALARRFI